MGRIEFYVKFNGLKSAYSAIICYYNIRPIVEMSNKIGRNFKRPIKLFAENKKARKADFNHL